jgi:hypothetical protein
MNIYIVKINQLMPTYNIISSTKVQYQQMPYIFVNLNDEFCEGLRYFLQKFNLLSFSDSNTVNNGLREMLQ